MPTLNQYPRNIQIRAINRLIMKYGHLGSIITDGGIAEDCMVLFGKYKITFGGGTLIINNNYKLHVKPIGKLKFDTQPDPTTEITVNGAFLQAVNARKIAPDGANPIVWEIEATGDVIPYDTVTIVDPTISLPADLTENYATTGNSGALWAVDMVSSPFDTTGGDDTLVGMDWEIATDNIFTSVVASVTAYTGGTTWNTGNVLSRDTNYWARVKHVGTITGASDWSPTVKFSLDDFVEAPTTSINTPSIIAPATDGLISTSLRNEGYGATDNKYRVSFVLSAYDPVTAGALTAVHWQFSLVSDFSTIYCECDTTSSDFDETTGGYDPDTRTCVMPQYGATAPFPYPLVTGTTYYCRAKDISGTDESEYSAVRTFTVPA